MSGSVTVSPGELSANANFYTEFSIGAPFTHFMFTDFKAFKNATDISEISSYWSTSYDNVYPKLFTASSSYARVVRYSYSQSGGGNTVSQTSEFYIKIDFENYKIDGWTYIKYSFSPEKIYLSSYSETISIIFSYYAY